MHARSPPCSSVPANRCEGRPLSQPAQRRTPGRHRRAARASPARRSDRHRFEELLRTLCKNGQRIYLAEVRRALDSGADPWEAYTEFLRRIVAANTHGLTVRLAGMFQPSEEQLALAEQMRTLTAELFERARASGQLRDDVTFLDVEYLMEFLARVKLGAASRTAELRQRHLAVIIDGLRSGNHTPLPGAPPTWEEQTQRWITR